MPTGNPIHISVHGRLKKRRRGRSQRHRNIVRRHNFQPSGKNSRENSPPNTSIDQAECLAINQALILVHRLNGQSNAKIQLYSDSQAALAAATSKGKVNSFSSHTHRLLLEFPSRIELFWSPGHSQTEGNEVADVAAKEAARSLSSSNLREVPIGKQTILAAVKNLLYKQWNETWQTTDVGRQTREFFPTLEDANILRSNFIHHELTQVLTGHSMLNSHQFKIGAAQSPLCNCGEESETVRHFLLACPNFAIPRLNIRAACRFLGIDFPPALSEFPKHQPLRQTLRQFVHSAKRLTLPTKSKTTPPPQLHLPNTIP